ncbi:DUF6249 domain-containing protein [Pedobacter sp. Du54]|uniref:DUF6249 domain-containing protein n=1 Tax=Pedobacter anseongensis TaxID=3133439 RepID=UPI0030B3886F
MNDIEQYIGMAFVFMVTLCFFLAWFFWQRARHRELMLMIEKGLNPSEHTQSIGQVLRKVAILLLGFAAGSIVIEIMEALELRSLISDSGYFAVFAIFIGIALLIITRSPGPSKND